MECSPRADVPEEALHRRGPESAHPGGFSERGFVVGPELLDRLVIGNGNVSGRMHADGALGLAELGQSDTHQPEDLTSGWGMP